MPEFTDTMSAVGDVLAHGESGHDDEYSCAVGLGAALEAFKESEQVRKWIEEIPEMAEKVDGAFEMHRQRYEIVLDWYQEQPHLLDCHLQDLVAILIGFIRGGSGKDAEVEARIRNYAAAFATRIVKVRTAKVVVRFLPHEVDDMDPILTLLEKESDKSGNWETRYMLLLWMSMLVLIPFDMKRFDSGEQKDTVTERILNVIQTNLAWSNKSQDAAAFLAAKFLTRPEIIGRYLPPFVEFCKKTITDDKADDFMQMGCLKALAAVYKIGKREDLLGWTPELLKLIMEQKYRDNRSALLRKLSLKLVQRLGLNFLKTKVASWRYQRGSRSLAVNLEGGQAKDGEGKNVPSSEGNEELAAEEDEDYDIPDEIEEVIEEMLVGLRDRDTTVRWSAAKGIGRVTNRLPKELADDVVGTLLQVFSLRETDSAWHGGCLAVAELGRRGLLLPQRLSEVVQVLLRALVYDERKGSYSVGSHIRDAACYVCWSLARAFDPEIVRPHVAIIARCLINVTIFDREVQCRRAASAAFQENVGRQGTFPHGIDIITEADYFAVGSRQNTYLKLSVFVARFPEYTESVVDHLLKTKVGHWDVGVRELTAEALHNLTAIAPDTMANSVLPALLKDVTAVELFTKHGAITCVGFVIKGLSGVGKDKGQSLKGLIGEEALAQVRGIAIGLVQRLVLRAPGGDLLRQAVTSYIDNCSQAGFPADEELIDLWKGILLENLSNVDPLINEKAIAAVPHFLEEYYKDAATGKVKEDLRDALLENFTSELDASEVQRRGFVSALGSFPKFALVDKVPFVLEILIRCTEITPGKEKWAEARRDSVRAILNIVKTGGIKKEQDSTSIGPSTLVRLYECFIAGLGDYTMDRRGDIGAWVRESCMEALHGVTLLVMKTQPDLVSDICVRDFMPLMAQQTVEKIDRTRGLAARLFAELVFHEPQIPGIPEREELLELFSDETRKDTFLWKSENETFPIFTQLLFLDAYRERVVLGLFASVGGMTERLVKASTAATFAQLEKMTREQLDRVCSSILNVFRENQKVDRVTTPLFKFLDQLLTSGHLDDVLEDTESSFSVDLLALVKAEVNKLGEPNKLMLSCDVLCALLAAADKTCVKKCLVQLSIFLCHRFPRMRKVTAGKLFEALLTYSDKEIVPEGNLDEINSILSDTNWDGQIEELRPVRNKLCDLMGVPAPTVVKKIVA